LGRNEASAHKNRDLSGNGWRISGRFVVNLFGEYLTSIELKISVKCKIGLEISKTKLGMMPKVTLLRKN